MSLRLDPNASLLETIEEEDGRYADLNVKRESRTSDHDLPLLQSCRFQASFLQDI